MTGREKIIALVDNDNVRPSDAIILLEGDGLNRYKEVVRLFKGKMASKIVFSGGITDYAKGAVPHAEIVPLMIADGIPEESIIIERKSTNTREQAIEVIRLALSHAWKSVILVASHYHQYRAYLTFLGEVIEKRSNIIIYNAPVRDLPWFEDNAWGKRIDLLEQEFKKIEVYSATGPMASVEEAIDHQRRKEKQG